METDILNNILNKTISNLFSDKIKHISYLSLDDPEDDYPSKKLIQKEDPLGNDLQTYKPKTKTFQPEPQSNKNPQQVVYNTKTQPQLMQQSQTLCTPELWTSTIGKKKFEESMKKLGVDEKIIKSKTYVNLSLDILLQKKTAVKNELKKYDNDFMDIFKQPPSRNDKEIMKPLYIYYKTLKIAIEKKEKQQDNMSTASTMVGENSSNNNNYRNNSQGSQVSQGSQGSHGNQQHRQQVDQRRKAYENNAGIHKKSNSSSEGTNNAQKNNVIGNNVQPEKRRALSKAEKIKLESEYNDIKNEQNNLRNKLHSYQEEFQKNNNRKVKYLKDITPVEKEYQKYKANKNRLKEIKDIIFSASNSNINNNQG